MEQWIDFADLKRMGVVRNRTTLYRWIHERDFPRGTLIGPNSRRWTEKSVKEWLADRAALEQR